MMDVNTITGDITQWDVNTGETIKEVINGMKLRVCWGEDPIIVEISNPNTEGVSVNFNFEALKQLIDSYEN